jgi:hypothetical protein
MYPTIERTNKAIKTLCIKTGRKLSRKMAEMKKTEMAARAVHLA